MTTPADRLLPLLDGVRRTGPSTWSTRCPAHDDRSPSLSIKEVGDGRLLLKCWAGCTAGDVVAAVGLDLRDLFPPRAGAPGAGSAPVRRPWLATDLLRLAAHEAGIVVLVVADSVAGRDVSVVDHDRMVEAAARLADFVEAADGRR